MNDTPETLCAAMVAHRFADEDEARRSWLDSECRKPYQPDNECPNGHKLDGVKRNGGRTVRYCKVCNRERMAAARAARGHRS
jgi:hypothetical protein